MSVGKFIRLGVSLVVAVVLGLLINYLAMPAMTIHSTGFWWFVGGELIIFAVCYFISSAIADDLDEAPAIGIAIAAAIGVWLVFFIITAIIGSQMANAYDYQKVATVEDNTSFEEDFLEAETDNLIIVDVATAKKLGDRTLGTIPNSSWYEVDDEYNLILINGEEYRISPINYGGFWKYNKAKEAGIPGYVIVNAKNQESKLVILDEPMKYSPSAYWRYDLTRNIHNDYPTYILDKSFFEVDDEGNPYWITGVKTPTIGLRGGMVISSVIITNAVTGENTEYELDKLPEWVDHTMSVSYLMELAKWHYCYTEGFINFSNTNVYRTSYYYKGSNSESSKDNEANKYTPFEGYNSIVAKDGSIWFYTGITPANSAETNVGFLLISPRTGEMKFYAASGAEESSAQIAAEGLVSNMKYSASFPTIVNIGGEETYFMTLKDGGGLVQRYAFCNMKNYAKCVCATTIKEAINLYKIEIGFAKDEVDNTSNTEKDDQQNTVEENREYKDATGKVTFVSEAQIDGYTYYYFVIENDESMIFMSSIENSNKQPMKLQIGTEVTIQYYESIKEDGIGIVTKIKFE